MRPSPRRINRSACLIATALIAGFLAVCFMPGTPVAGTPKAGKVIVFVIDQVNLQEIDEADMPNLKALINKGAVGSLSVRGQNVGDPVAQYLTIGAGGKAVGLPRPSGQAERPLVLEGFSAGEMIFGRSAADIYKERTGRNYFEPQAANLSLSGLVDANIEAETDAIPGTLGEVLRGAGLKTAVIGNADTQDAYNRSVIDILMNNDGLVDYGRLDKDVLAYEASSPSGWRADSEKLFATYAAGYGTADVVAIDWGDTSRIRAETRFITSGREITLIKKSLKRADDFLAKILDTVDLTRDLVIIVSPTPSLTDIKNNRLVTPVVIAGAGIGKGLLTSASTRREGVIVNTDIAPTILKHLGVKQPASMTGRPAYAVTAQGDALVIARNMSDRWVVVRNLMNPVLRGIAYWDIAIIILFMLLLMLERFRPVAAKIRWLLLTLPVVPLVTILLPLLNYGPPALVIAEIVILTAGLVAAVYRLARTPVEAVGAIALSVTAALLIDLATGTRLIQDSILGYAVVNGARFYGIGNEYVGVLIGGTVVGAFFIMSLSESRPRNILKAAAIGLMLVTTVMIGAPQFGAEFGGFLAAILGFGLMSMGYIIGGYRPRDLILLAAAGTAAVTAFVLYDVSRGAAGGSHVGQLVSQIQTEGVAPLFVIVNRKIAMNIKLVQYAFWNWINIVSAAAMLVAFYGLRNLLKLVFRRYPYFKPTLVGGLSACVAALFFNDSGVVAMAMIFIYLVPATLYLTTYEIEG